jgi:hypothetical protein
MDVFFQARRRFSELVHDPKMGIAMQLRPGDIIVFDNKRLLHSRGAIAPTDRERHLQGCYMDGDGVKVNHERLRRVANDQELNGTDGSGPPATAWHALSDTTKEDTIAPVSRPWQQRCWTWCELSMESFWRSRST